MKFQGWFLLLFLLLNFPFFSAERLAPDRNSILVIPFTGPHGEASDLTQEFTELALKNVAIAAEGVRIFTLNKEIVTRLLSRAEAIELARSRGIATLLWARITRLDKDPEPGQVLPPGSQFLQIQSTYELIEATSGKTIYTARCGFASIHLQPQVSPHMFKEKAPPSEISQLDPQYVLDHVMQRCTRKIAKDLVRHHFALLLDTPVTMHAR